MLNVHKLSKKLTTECSKYFENISNLTMNNYEYVLRMDNIPYMVAEVRVEQYNHYHCFYVVVTKSDDSWQHPESMCDASTHRTGLNIRSEHDVNISTMRYF